MEQEDCDDPDGAADQYRAIKIRMDRLQATVHVARAVLVVVLIIGGVWWFFRSKVMGQK